MEASHTLEYIYLKTSSFILKRKYLQVGRRYNLYQNLIGNFLHIWLKSLVKIKS